jgi:hypothetical protein
MAIDAAAHPQSHRATQSGYVRLCDAGRQVVHPDRPGWQLPCPYEGTCYLAIRGMDDGSTLHAWFCSPHIDELADMGLTSEIHADLN